MATVSYLIIYKFSKQMKKGFILAVVAICIAIVGMSFTTTKKAIPLCYNSRYNGTCAGAIGYMSNDAAMNAKAAYKVQTAQNRIIASERVYSIWDASHQLYHYYFEVCYEWGFE